MDTIAPFLQHMHSGYIVEFSNNTIYAYVEDYHTCSGIFNKPVNAGMDNAGKFKKWHL